MALPPNTKLDDDILVAARSSDTAAVAYALLRVGSALDGIDGHSPDLIAALNNIANKIEDGLDKIANAISNHP